MQVQTDNGLGPFGAMVEAIAARTAEIVLARLREQLSATAIPEQLLDVAETARRLAVASGAVYKLSESGSLPHVKVGGRLRFRAADVDGYIRGRRGGEAEVVALARAARAPRIRA